MGDLDSRLSAAVRRERVDARELMAESAKKIAKSAEMSKGWVTGLRMKPLTYNLRSYGPTNVDARAKGQGQRVLRNYVHFPLRPTHHVLRTLCTPPHPAHRMAYVLCNYVLRNYATLPTPRPIGRTET
ncbi:MAG: hypothetical protein AMXMBFR16_01450 [Candidatus Uhrbacteria bacterium]